MQGIPLYLGEDSARLFRTCLVSTVEASKFLHLWEGVDSKFFFSYIYFFHLGTIFLFFQETDPDDSQTRGLKLGVLMVHENNGGPTSQSILL